MCAELTEFITDVVRSDLKKVKRKFLFYFVGWFTIKENIFRKRSDAPESFNQ